MPRKLRPCLLCREPCKLIWIGSPCPSAIQLGRKCPSGKLTEEGKALSPGLNDRPEVDCLLWWSVGPWEYLPMGPAVPDVDENKLLRRVEWLTKTV